MNYARFIEGKTFANESSGFNVSLEEINSKLFDFQRVITRWALAKGCAAVYADTGLGKTAIQLEWARHIVEHTSKSVLIIAPLSVSQQTVTEAEKFNVKVTYVRSQNHVKAKGVYITNYEMIERFNFKELAGVVLDESSILKSFTGKIRSLIIEACRYVPYKLSCTATPSPNDFMELGNQAEFIGVMNHVEMLAMFFIHDSGDTRKWRLKGHGQVKFWEWLSTWAIVIRKPSDLGFNDDGYNLPALTIHKHIVDYETPAYGALFHKPAMTLNEQRIARRDSLQARVNACADLVNSDSELWIVWCHLNDESDALSYAISDSSVITGGDSIEYKERVMNAFTNKDDRVLVTKPSIAGFGMNWQHCANVAFVGLNHSFESFYQAIRRCWRFGQIKPVNVHVFLSPAVARSY